MIFNTSGGGIAGSGSGTGLNFRVIGATSEPNILIENTIWVNTNVEINGWLLDHEEPASHANGMVWVQISNNMLSDVEFNTLKRNGVMVRPLAAFQWDGSQWVEKAMKVYQNGYWGETWSGIIFDNGTIYNDIPYDTHITGAGHIYVGEEYIGFWSDIAEGGGTGRVSFGAIDITGFKTLTVTGSFQQEGGNIDAWIADAPGSTTRIAGGSTSASAGGSATLTVDISSVTATTPLYVVVQLARYGTLGTNAYIYHVKLNR